MINLENTRKIQENVINSLDSTFKYNSTYQPNKKKNLVPIFLRKEKGNNLPNSLFASCIQLNNSSTISTKPLRLFEEFFIVGISDTLLKEFPKNFETFYFKPEILFNYPNLLNEYRYFNFSEQKRIVKDFCFPNNVFIKKYKPSDSLTEAQLYSSLVYCIVVIRIIIKIRILLYSLFASRIILLKIIIIKMFFIAFALNLRNFVKIRIINASLLMKLFIA